MKKTNNKGFSLVELIVVIAIMAVLIGVLAPQFLKFVERGRNSTDLQNAQSLVSAIQTYAADVEATTALAEDTTGTTINVAASGTTVATGTNAAAITQAFTDSGITLADNKCKSKTAWTSYSITVKVVDTGAITFTYGPTDFATKMAQ